MIQINNYFINPSFIIEVELDMEFRGLKCPENETGRARLTIYYQMGQTVESHFTKYFDSKREVLEWYRQELEKEQFSLFKSLEIKREIMSDGQKG